MLESVSEALMLRHYSSRTREAYVSWVRRFVVHHLELIRSPGRVPKHYATFDFLSQVSNDVGVS